VKFRHYSLITFWNFLNGIFYLWIKDYIKLAQITKISTDIYCVKLISAGYCCLLLAIALQSKRYHDFVRSRFQFIRKWLSDQGRSTEKSKMLQCACQKRAAINFRRCPGRAYKSPTASNSILITGHIYTVHIIIFHRANKWRFGV
jgi:hypothetical protein